MNDRLCTTSSAEAIQAAVSAAAGAVEEIRDILGQAVAGRVIELVAAAEAEIAEARKTADELAVLPSYYSQRPSWWALEPFWRAKGYERQARMFAKRYADLRPVSRDLIVDAVWSGEPAP